MFHPLIRVLVLGHAGPASVANVMSAPLLVVLSKLTTDLKWYKVLGVKPLTGALNAPLAAMAIILVLIP